jgi:cyclopropane fatty-acyl-phospholipid synthase-like methyltransferase
MTTLINDDYKKQLQDMHQEPKAFYRGLKALRKIEHYLEKYQPKSLIDFGCSKGELHQELAKTMEKTAGYDPGIPEFETLPTDTYESLVALDVLEHIEPEMLDETLKTINNLFTKSCYLIVAAYPAKKFLPDGRNAHLIIESFDWWKNKLETYIEGKIVHTDNNTVIKTPKKGPSITGHEYIFVIEK